MMSLSHHESHPAETALLALPDPAATTALGARLAGLWRTGDVIALTGPLAAGKTSLARAALQAAAGAPIEVPSPTFTLVQTYDVPPAPVWHFDLYRLSEPEEVVELAWDEARAEGIVLVEWPDRLGPLLPADRLDIALASADGGRRAKLTAGPGWRDRLVALAEKAAP
jgi:tRNA threonylcarbamoyladenosine biosynthesis protein TsaE